MSAPTEARLAVDIGAAASRTVTVAMESMSAIYRQAVGGDVALNDCTRCEADFWPNHDWPDAYATSFMTFKPERHGRA